MLCGMNGDLLFNAGIGIGKVQGQLDQELPGKVDPLLCGQGRFHVLERDAGLPFRDIDLRVCRAGSRDADGLPPDPRCDPQDLIILQLFQKPELGVILHCQERILSGGEVEHVADPPGIPGNLCRRQKRPVRVINAHVYSRAGGIGDRVLDPLPFFKIQNQDGGGLLHSADQELSLRGLQERPFPVLLRLGGNANDVSLQHRRGFEEDAAVLYLGVQDCAGGGVEDIVLEGLPVHQRFFPVHLADYGIDVPGRGLRQFDLSQVGDAPGIGGHLHGTEMHTIAAGVGHKVHVAHGDILKGKYRVRRVQLLAQGAHRPLGGGEGQSRGDGLGAVGAGDAPPHRDPLSGDQVHFGGDGRLGGLQGDLAPVQPVFPVPGGSQGEHGGIRPA